MEKKMRTNQQGRSMIEMLGVLAIIGVLSIGGLAGYSRALVKHKTNTIMHQVVGIVTNIRTLYAQQRNYDGLNMESAIEMGVFPDELGTQAGNMHNPYGGQIFIGHSILDTDRTTQDPEQKAAFYIAYTALTRTTCTNLMAHDWGSSHSTGLVGMAAMGTTITEENISDIVNDPAFKKDHGMPCTGGNGANNSLIACANSKTNPTPMQLSNAAIKCACTDSLNTCSVVWKYY